MSKRKKVASVAFTGVAALGGVGLTAGHAYAATPTSVKVTPGGAYTAANSGNVILHDNTTNQTLTCTSAKATGKLPGSTKGNYVGSVATAPFRKCTVDGFSFSANLNKAAKLYATAATTGGKTPGELKSISATIQGKGLFASCTAKITGSLSGSYSNTHALLTIDATHAATLTVATATSGCSPVIKAADKAYFAGKYKVTPTETVTAN